MPQKNFWSKPIKGYMGQRRTYQTADDLLNACDAYFNWANDNPLVSDKVFSYQGGTNHGDEDRVRAFTLTGLCIHLGITMPTWYNYKKVTELADACAFAEQVIFTQKFEAAAADMLNPSMLTRDLGLVDKQQLESKGETSITFRRTVVDPKTGGAPPDPAAPVE